MYREGLYVRILGREMGYKYIYMYINMRGAYRGGVVAEKDSIESERYGKIGNDGG